MNKKECKIIGQIRLHAFDKRKRVLISEELEWMYEKMKEIRRLLKMFAI